MRIRLQTQKKGLHHVCVFMIDTEWTRMVVNHFQAYLVARDYR